MMNDTREIERIAADERSGMYTVSESCWRVFCLIDGRNLTDVVDGLPPALRDEFATWAHRHFANDRNRAEFLSVRGADHPHFEEALAAVRSWLAFG